MLYFTPEEKVRLHYLTRSFIENFDSALHNFQSHECENCSKEHVQIDLIIGDFTPLIMSKIKYFLNLFFCGSHISCSYETPRACATCNNHHLSLLLRPIRRRKHKPRIKPLEKKLVKDRSTKKSPRKIGRNDLCPCNSGKKYKKCCLKFSLKDLESS